MTVEAPSLVQHVQLAGWMDERRIRLAGISAGPCNGCKVPATLMVLSPPEQARTCQSWLANVAFGFTPVEIPTAAERAPAAGGVKREQDGAANEGQTADSAAAGEEAAAAGGQEAKRAKLEHDTQGGRASGHSCRLPC